MILLRMPAAVRPTGKFNTKRGENAQKNLTFRAAILMATLPVNDGFSAGVGMPYLKN
jgi:hypothetical protein